MDFFLFIIVTAILFIRPTDFVPGFESVPLYLIAMFLCILLSWHKLVPLLSIPALRELPVLVFGIALLLVAITSSLVHGIIAKELTPAIEFAKILFFFLLMQAQLDTRRRIRLYVGIVAWIVTIPVMLAVLNYHEYIHIEAFEAQKEGVETSPEEEAVKPIKRLRTTGNFSDPNDVCEIVNFAMIFSLFGLIERGSGCSRIVWLAPIALFGHALLLTQSRGGLLGFMAGLFVAFWSRFGTKKALLAAALAVPLILVFVAGRRQASLNVKEGTGQERVQLWDEAFNTIRQEPVLGAGWGEFTRMKTLAAHNALIHVSAELGLLASTLFVGQYFYCLKNLSDLNANRVILADPEMHRLQPFVLASVASLATSEMSITNPVSLITYVILGVGTAFIRVTEPYPPLRDLAVSGSLLGRAMVCCGLVLVALYVFVRFSVRYS